MLSTDGEGRTLQKWNDDLYQANGDRGPTCFPEGSKPLPTDDEERSMQKINALLS